MEQNECSDQNILQKWEDKNYGRYNTVTRLKEDLNKPREEYNRVDIYKTDTFVVEAMVRPDLHRNIAFPSMFATPGIPVHKYNTLNLITNNNGVCWAEVNFGQYLGMDAYLPSVAGFNTAVPFGRSNVFVSSPTSSLDGNSPYVLATTDIGQFQASDIMKEQLKMYNSVRAGPAAVFYDFTGRLDESSGVVTCGINYTFAKDNYAPQAPNGLLPDMNFTTLKAIEDCPYRVKASIVDSIHGCFVPHDTNVLNLKDPQAGETQVQQRFFLLITGAPANSRIGQLRIAMNYDGKPNAQYADNISTSLTVSPSYESLHFATNWLIQNNKVLRIAEDQGYGIKRFDGRYQ